MHFFRVRKDRFAVCRTIGKFRKFPQRMKGKLQPIRILRPLRLITIGHHRQIEIAAVLFKSPARRIIVKQIEHDFRTVFFMRTPV